MPDLHCNHRTISIAGLILDKDGTLHRFDSYWLPLVRARIQALAAHVGLPESDALHRRFGVAGGVQPEGLLAQGTRAEALIVAAGWLNEHGLSWSEAKAQAHAAFDLADRLQPPQARLSPVANLRPWLERWVAHGGQLAVASTASRRDVDVALDGLGIASLIPHRLGGDEVSQGKPHPEMVQRLAAAMQLAPATLAVVGDGRNDLLMGRAAGVGLCVGVTSGVETAETLAPLADLVVPELSALPLVDISS